MVQDKSWQWDRKELLGHFSSYFYGISGDSSAVCRRKNEQKSQEGSPWLHYINHSLLSPMLLVSHELVTQAGWIPGLKYGWVLIYYSDTATGVPSQRTLQFRNPDQTGTTKRRGSPTVATTTILTFRRFSLLCFKIRRLRSLIPHNLSFSRRKSLRWISGDRFQIAQLGERAREGWLPRNQGKPRRLQ